MVVPVDFVMSLCAFAVTLSSRKLALKSSRTDDVMNDVTFPEV